MSGSAPASRTACGWGEILLATSSAHRRCCGMGVNDGRSGSPIRRPPPKGGESLQEEANSGHMKAVGPEDFPTPPLGCPGDLVCILTPAEQSNNRASGSRAPFRGRQEWERGKGRR